MIGDSAYSGKDNLKKARDEHFKLVAKLNPSISQGFRKGKDKFDYNKDAGMFFTLPARWPYVGQNKGERIEHGIRHILIILMCISVYAAQNGRGVINRELNLKPILYPLKPMSSSEQVP